jgi:hypothetical protein
MAAVIATERRLRTRMPGREPVVQNVVNWRTVRGYGPRPRTDHVVFTSRACRRARPWRHYLLGYGRPLSPSQRWPPGAAPLTTPQWGCAPSRGTPDGLIPIVLRASGWRSSPVPGARPRLRPPARRGRVSRSHRLIRATPCRRSSHILERMLPVRIAPLGQPVDTMLRSGLDAASFMPP